MKSLLMVAGCAASAVLCSLAIHGCAASNDDPSSQSCARVEGTWDGLEMDPSGGIRGTATFVVRDGQIEGEIERIGASPESYTLRAKCNEAVAPHQLSGTITASNRPEAVGQPFYSIYELNETASTGRLSGFKPGTTEFPTTFSAGSGQRLFVFGETDAGPSDTGGSSTADTEAGAGGG